MGVHEEILPVMSAEGYLLTSHKYGVEICKGFEVNCLG